MRTILPHIGGTQNETPELCLLRCNSKDAQGLSLYSCCCILWMQYSTPCDNDAKSLDFTLDSNHSICSGGKATVRDRLRTFPDIYANCMRIHINTCKQNALTSCKTHDGVAKNERNPTNSESYGLGTDYRADDKLPGNDQLRREQHGHSRRTCLPSLCHVEGSDLGGYLRREKNGFQNISLLHKAPEVIA
jgi:hypothetical protein